MSDPNFNNNNVNPPPKKGGTSIALNVGGHVDDVLVLYWLFAGGTDVDNADMVGEETNINVDAGAESAAESIEDAGEAVEAEIDETAVEVEDTAAEAEAEMDSEIDATETIEVEGEAEVVQ